ncbi:biogenesis of lysosome-related organelles complex 1 subunit Cnl1p [Monosporozyma servazzii]
MNSNPEGSRSNEEEEDALGINKLIIAYDYLLYKINDHVQSIQYRTDMMCKRQNQLIEEDIIRGQIDVNIEHFKHILKQCDELETHFDMMDQIDTIVQTFKDRLQDINAEYNNIRRNTSK